AALGGAGLNSATGLSGGGATSGLAAFAPPGAAVADGAGAGVSTSGPNSASGSSAGSLDGNGLAMTPVTPAVVQEAFPRVRRFEKRPSDDVLSAGNAHFSAGAG